MYLWHHRTFSKLATPHLLLLNHSLFGSKSLKWFAILIISLSPNSLIFSVGQVCVSSSETKFSKTGECLRSSDLDFMLTEIKAMALQQQLFTACIKKIYFDNFMSW